MFKLVIGMWRLRWGFCPLCNSSPPDASCHVCRGSYNYGRSKSRRIQREQGEWWNRYTNYLKDKKIIKEL